MIPTPHGKTCGESKPRSVPRSPPLSPTLGQTGSRLLPLREPQEMDTSGMEKRNPGFSKTESVAPTIENPR